jgi:citrate lyase beta subunit
MIDPTPRADLIMSEANDPTISVILLDVVLGTGSHVDPAGALIPALQHAQKAAQARGGRLSVVTSVTGTIDDSQGLESQIAKLRQIGVVVLPSNIEAVRFAYAIAAEKAHVK